MKTDPAHLAGQASLEAHLSEMRAARTVPAWRWIIRLILLVLLLTEVNAAIAGHLWSFL